MSRLEFAIYSCGEYVVTRLAGNVDLAASQELRIFFSEVFSQTDRLIVDLSQVPVMDASGLDVLVELDAWARACGAQLRLAAPQPQVCKLLSRTDAYQQLQPFPTVEAAATPTSAALVDPVTRHGP